MFALKVFVCLAIVLYVQAAPQGINQQPQPQAFNQVRPQNNVAIEPQQNGAEENKDLKGSNSFGYGFYGGGYPGYGGGYGGYGGGYPFGGYGSSYLSGYGSSYYGGYPYYRNFGGLYGGYWY